jgi:uncharacterized protein involved in outer membrane biogenesis
MKKFLLVLLALIVVVILVANFFLGDLVKKVAEKVGPTVVGVPLTLEKAEFRLLRGHVSLKGFALGNPEGFKTDKAIGVGEVTVDIKPASLLSDTIVIKRIYVNAPEINYELGLGTSNIGKIMDGLSRGKEGEPEKKEEKPAAKTEGGKKVVIEDLLIEGGMIKIAAKIAGGVGAPVPLPPVHLTNVGKEEGGASVADVVGKVFGEVFSAIGGVVSGVGGLAVDGVEGAGKLAVSGAEAAGGAAVEGAEAVGGAAAEGAKAVGDAAGKVMKGIGGLLGGEKKE